MTKLVKTGDKIGVATQAQGYRVAVVPHPRFKGMWQFELKGEIWIASDYVFVEGSTIE